MPNATVAANAAPMPAVHRIYGFLTADLRIHLPGLMRRAVNRARYEYRLCAGRKTWRQVMSAALRDVWSEAKGMQASLRAQMKPAPVMSPLARAELDLLTAECAERPSRVEAATIPALRQRVVELRASA